jgi:type IV secretion system protein VirB10
VRGAADAEREIARELRLRGDPPRVARLSRRVLIGGAAAACLAIAGAVGWSLLPSSGARTVSPNPAAGAPSAPPRQLSDLPKDYGVSADP